MPVHNNIWEVAKQPLDLDWSPLLEVCDGVMAVVGGGVMLVKSVSNVVCW